MIPLSIFVRVPLLAIIKLPSILTKWWGIRLSNPAMLLGDMANWDFSACKSKLWSYITEDNNLSKMIIFYQQLNFKTMTYQQRSWPGIHWSYSWSWCGQSQWFCWFLRLFFQGGHYCSIEESPKSFHCDWTLWPKWIKKVNIDLLAPGKCDCNLNP